MDLLLEGYTLVEGPCSDASGNLYFSDIYDGGVYRRDRGGDVSVIVPKRRAVGGIALHAEGGVVVSGRDVQHVREGAIRTLLSDPTVRTYNDLSVDSHGSVIVGSVRDRYPDGTAIGAPGMEPEHRRNPYGELYRISRDRVELLYEFDGLSNGIVLSQDGTKMFHVTSVDGIITHDVSSDGRLTGRGSIPIERGSADGLAADTSDHLWAAGGSVVSRLSFSGEVVDGLDVPSDRVISLCFGGDRPRDLYITTGGHAPDERGGRIFRTRVAVEGCRRPLARV